MRAHAMCITSISTRRRCHLRGMTEEWQRLGVLNYEMESATLLTICSAFGLRAGCVTGEILIAKAVRGRRRCASPRSASASSPRMVRCFL